ncbi:MAG: hypothetical protein AUG44_10370 [Actinobacteria bacterium 13_1_20CM_3_71_11]|nr:MAG: hypothetical protein AUG44_10370 [Actinobacteria bacterium 13_1_20CM_3_71_11]
MEVPATAQHQIGRYHDDGADQPVHDRGEDRVRATPRVLQLGRVGGRHPERAVDHPAERHDQYQAGRAHPDRDRQAEQEAPDQREALPRPAPRTGEQPTVEVADRLAGTVVHEEQRDHLQRQGGQRTADAPGSSANSGQ